MSAIWGAIDLTGNPIDKEKQVLLRQAFDKCVIDRYEELIDRNVYMGCGIQYFTPEAVNEKLPFNENEYFFTADVVLDNREELLEKLGISKDNGDNMPDGEILYTMYKHHGKECLNDLLGAYTFIWYDRTKNKVELILDATGNRCVYYRIIGNIFYFSSLIEPLAELTGDTRLNDRWITDFLAMDYLYMVNETEETPVKDIYRPAPAQYISYMNGKLEKEIYWKPFDNFKEYRYSSDDEYKSQFRELWDKAVKGQIRDKKNTSILLSGGLDSTAVAAIAAPYLKESEEKLYSYTSVPMKGYKADNSGYDVEDESEDVEKTAAFYGNIVTNYVDLDGKNPWELISKAVESMEIPVKSIQNFLWIFEAMEKAYSNNSRIMLTGSYGNTSISYTNLNLYMNLLYKDKKYLKLKKEIDAFSKSMGFNSRYAWKQIFRDNNQEFEKSSYPFGDSYVSRDMTAKFDSDKKLYDIGKTSFLASRDIEHSRKNKVHPLAMRQLGETHTKQSLFTGVLLRDPTIDKRVIEFCIHIPAEQFCKNGIDRRLVKVYLKDIMPPHVMNFDKKGKQSADLNYRFSLNWNEIRDEWIKTYEKYSDSVYINTLYARRQLLEQADIKRYSAFDLTRHMYTLMVLKYENYFKNRYGCENHIGHEEKILTNPLVSVIIPVYNAEKYLKRCLESVCRQSYKNLEIIVVDDGSKDKSGEICDKISKADSRVHVIHKKNEGVSAARNDALAYAHGEIYTFVDSDDEIEHDMYERMLLIMQEQNAECICCGIKYIKNGQINDHSTDKVKLFYNEEMFDAYIAGFPKYCLSVAMWNGLYRKELFADIKFPPTSKYEDDMTKTKLMYRIKTGILFDHSFYHYLIRENGLSDLVMSRSDIKCYLEENKEKIKYINDELCTNSKNVFYFNYYYVLIETYFATSDKKSKRMISKATKEIRKDVRRAIMNKVSISTRDKLLLMISTYSILLYKLTLHRKK